MTELNDNLAESWDIY